LSGIAYIPIIIIIFREIFFPAFVTNTMAEFGIGMSWFAVS